VSVSTPFVHLPSWNASPDPGRDAPFTSITQWTWEELHYENRVLSLSKRAGYLPYSTLPVLAGRPFQLAVNIGPTDPAGDAVMLKRNGWTIVNPHEMVATPEGYREYIKKSRAEFSCPKPIHIQLNTGWLSDRSVAYLATGRPVIAVDTGFADKIPTGEGLIAVRNLDEAVRAIAAIDADYPRHSRAAREIAEGCFDARRCLGEMIAACG
jgi:glycosyltransferase involved in cell wall biosynthesis